MARLRETTLPSVPPGATDISFGAAIAGNGRMTLDNFRIVETRAAAKCYGGIDPPSADERT
jgi:hypothetical protein